MNIFDILEDKTQKILNGQEYVGLTGDEMNILSDPEQLRALKLFIKMPSNYQRASNLNDCINRIREGDCLYRTLEYCVIANRALRSIKQYVEFKGAPSC